MTTNTNYTVALRFARADAYTKAGAYLARGLSGEANALLWADDDGGDLYMAGLNLLASIGPMRSPITYDIFLEAFPEWWKLDAAAAKVIVQEIDHAVDSKYLNQCKTDLALVATWFDEDEREFELKDRPISWLGLRAAALDWEQQDTVWMRSNPAQWKSELAPNSYSYYTVAPILNTSQLLSAGASFSKALKSRKLQDMAVAGQARLFTVGEVLKKLRGPIAVVVIENTSQGWQTSRVHMKGGLDVPQSMYRLARQLAAQYQSRTLASNRGAQLKAATHKIREAPSLQSLVGDGGGPQDENHATASTEETSYQKPTPAEERKILFVDTCTLLDTAERAAVSGLIRDFAGTVVIVGAVIEELERKKMSRPDLVRDANAALRSIEQWTASGKARIEGLDAKRHRTYADEAILQSASDHINAGAMVTIVTADIALRVRARGTFPTPRLMTIDSKALVETENGEWSTIKHTNRFAPHTGKQRATNDPSTIYLRMHMRNVSRQPKT